MAAIGGLALLSTVHWLRDMPSPGFQLGVYLLGVLPNFGAAIAITFVLLSIWADQNKKGNFRAARRGFLVSATISGVGLIGWEFVQRTGSSLVFDPHDIAATLAGLGAAGLLFYALTPGPIESTEPGD